MKSKELVRVEDMMSDGAISFPVVLAEHFECGSAGQVTASPSVIEIAVACTSNNYWDCTCM